MKHAIAVLKDNLDFQKKKLETTVKAWEPEMKLRIENKISELEMAIRLLNKKNKSDD